jgi:hypothetical protein
MNMEYDFDLTPCQWEALKALRPPQHEWRSLSRPVVRELIGLELAALNGDRPVITSKGRSVLLRGSPRLLDLAA